MKNIHSEVCVHASASVHSFIFYTDFPPALRVHFFYTINNAFFFLLYIWCGCLKRHHSLTFRTYILSTFLHMFLHTSGGSEQQKVQLPLFPGHLIAALNMSGDNSFNQAAADSHWVRWWLTDQVRESEAWTAEPLEHRHLEGGGTNETWPVCSTRGLSMQNKFDSLQN